MNYINKYELTFTEMAERVGISRAALRTICLKKNNPGKKTIYQLASVLNVTENELCRIICQNKLRQIYKNNESIDLTFRAIDSLVGMLYKQYKILPEPKEPLAYDIYHHALKSFTKLP